MALLDTSQSWNLFGYDVRQGLYFFTGGWRDFLWGTRSPVRDTLDETVEVETASGERFCYHAGNRVAQRKTLAKALLLPDELILHKTLHLPAAAEGNIESVIAMEVMANSPFPADDTAHAWLISGREDERLAVELVICARSAIMAFVSERHDTHDLQAYEVWADAGNEQYVELAGFGEGARAGRYRQRLVRAGATLAYCVGIVVVLFAVGAGFKYLEMQRVQSILEETRAEAKEAVALRGRLSAGNELIKAANAITAATPDLYEELTELSKMLDDDTWVTQVDVKGRVIRIDGQSPDAATVMQQLTDEPRYARVSALVPIKKVPRSELERFVFELEIAAQPGPSS